MINTMFTCITHIPFSCSEDTCSSVGQSAGAGREAGVSLVEFLKFVLPVI
jgi:hypothetical protein